MKGLYAFVLFFVYVVFQGALRKWYFPSLGTPLYMLQYVLVFGFYFLAPKKSSVFKYEKKPAFMIFLLIYFAYGLLEMFNFRGTDQFIVQIYGIVMHFAFVPMIFFVPRTLDNEEQFNKILTGMSWLLAGVFCIGFVQFFSSPDAFINRYATEQEAGSYEVVIAGGGRVRIAGTFSYLATYASFLSFILHILLYALLTSVIKNKIKPIFLIAYTMGVLNIFMTGSRGPTGYYAITEAITILVLVLSGQLKFLNKLFPIGIALIVVYLIVISTSAGSTVLGDSLMRFQGNSDLVSRIELFPFLSREIDPVGFGIGTAQPSMGPFLSFRNDMPYYYEIEYDRITVELGIIGYILIMILRFAVFFTCWSISRNVKRIEFKILATQMTMLQLPYLVNQQTNIFNYIDGMFYWIAIGLVYFAYYLDMKNKDSKPATIPVTNSNYKWS